MHERLLVSIIIDNYNYARFLPEAIDSALNQSYPHIEVIVVDDGSTDDSREVIAGYGNRITAILKENAGQASAFNSGFEVSRGKVVLFLDSDDSLCADAVAKAIQAFQERNVVKVQWPLWEIDELVRKTGNLKPASVLAHGDFRDEVIRSGPIPAVYAPTSGNAWRRTFLERVMPVQECGDKHGADAYLNALAPIFGALHGMSEPLAYYRVHTGSFTGRTVRDILIRHLSRYDYLSNVVGEFLRRTGVTPRPEDWKGADSSYRWMLDMIANHDEILEIVDAGTSFILVDDGILGTGFITGRTAIPFLEHDGQYWGPPEDDAVAIREMDRLRRLGAKFIVFFGHTFWWLECFEGFASHLRANCDCVVHNSRLIVFDIATRRSRYGNSASTG